MSIGALHRWTLLGTPTLAVLTVVGGSALLAGAGAALVLVLLLSSGQLLDAERTPTRTWVTHGVTVAVLVAAIGVFRTARIDAVLIVVMLGVFNRFLLRTGARDDFIIVGASSVLLAAGTTVTPGIGFALLLGLYVPVLLWTLYASTLLGTAEAVRPTLEPRTRVRMARRPVPAQRGFIAASSIALMLAGYTLVSLFPRYHFGRFFSAGYFMALPGASSSMTLGNGGVSNSEVGAVALRIEPNPDAANRPNLSGIYARLHALDRFDGRTWSASPDRGRFPLYGREDNYEGLPDVWRADDSARTVKIFQERARPRGEAHPIVTLGWVRPSWVKARHPLQSFAGEWQSRFRRTAVKLVYKVDLDVASPSRPLPRHLRAAHAASLVDLPSDLDPRIVALAEQLGQGAETDADRVRAVLGHFDRGYSYSLEPLEGEAEDPLVRFLFEAKRGHCELYAGAVAVLLRANGVRARVATGYYGGWWNSSGGYLELSDADAHAWVEVYDEDQGWRWVDATPESLRARRKTKSLAWLRDLYDAIEAAWFDNVIDFDDRKRRALIESISKRFSFLGGTLPSFEDGPAGGGGQSKASWLVILVLFLLLAGGASWLRGRLRPGIDGLGPRLRRGLDPEAPAHEPLGALLARAPGALEGPARDAVQAFEALRYGPPDGAPDLADVDRKIRALEAARRSLR